MENIEQYEFNNNHGCRCYQP